MRCVKFLRSVRCCAAVLCCFAAPRSRPHPDPMQPPGPQVFPNRRSSNCFLRRLFTPQSLYAREGSQLPTAYLTPRFSQALTFLAVAPAITFQNPLLAGVVSAPWFCLALGCLLIPFSGPALARGRVRFRMQRNC